MILDSQLEDGTPIKLPGIVPKLSGTPGGVKRNAPKLGQDTDHILDQLGIDADTRKDWRNRGIIRPKKRKEPARPLQPAHYQPHTPRSGRRESIRHAEHDLAKRSEESQVGKARVRTVRSRG